MAVKKVVCTYTSQSQNLCEHIISISRQSEYQSLWFFAWLCDDRSLQCASVPFNIKTQRTDYYTNYYTIPLNFAHLHV